MGSSIAGAIATTSGVSVPGNTVAAIASDTSLFLAVVVNVSYPYVREISG